MWALMVFVRLMLPTLFVIGFIMALIGSLFEVCEHLVGRLIKLLADFYENNRKRS